MKTIALRFGEHFSPDCGTIAAHQEIIDTLGYVWYGKMGNRISDNVKKKIFIDEKCKILLIRSGHSERYWAYVEAIANKVEDVQAVPSYYRADRDRFYTWFKITSFTDAPKDIMSKCIVISSGQQLGTASKHSMSPYFKIEYKE